MDKVWTRQFCLPSALLIPALSSLAFIANALRFSSFFSFSLCAIFCSIWALVSTASRAWKTNTTYTHSDKNSSNLNALCDQSFQCFSSISSAQKKKFCYKLSLMMMILCLKSLSTLFKSYWDNEKVIIKRSMQLGHELNSIFSGIWTLDLLIQNWERKPFGHLDALIN